MVYAEKASALWWGRCWRWRMLGRLGKSIFIALIVLGVLPLRDPGAWSQQLVVAVPLDIGDQALRVDSGRLYGLEKLAGATETLVEIGSDTVLKGVLAQRWRALSLTQWEFVLRSGILFHDGQYLDAQKVKESFSQILQKGSGAYHPILATLLDIREIEVRNTRTVVFHLNQPNSTFVHLLADPATAVVQAPREVGRSSGVVGTGPFTFVSAEPGERYTVRAFPKYWGGVPRLKTITLRMITDPVELISGLKGMNLDVIWRYPSASFAAIAREDGDIKRFSVPTTETIFLQSRLDGGALANNLVRQAVSLALDRQEIVDTLMAGVAASPAISMIPPVVEPWHDDRLALSYDLVRAREILEGLGITGEKIVVGVDKELGNEASSLVSMVQRMLSRVGFVVESKENKAAVNRQLMRSGDLDLYIQQFRVASGGEPGLFFHRFLHSQGDRNLNSYSNSQFDQYLRESRREISQNKRRDIYSLLQGNIHMELPLIPLLHRIQTAVSSRYVQGLHFSPGQDRLASPVLAVTR